MEINIDRRKLKRSIRRLLLLISGLIIFEILTFSVRVIPEWLDLQGMLMLLSGLTAVIVSVFLAIKINKLWFGKFHPQVVNIRFKKVIVSALVVFGHVVVVFFLTVFGGFKISSLKYITKTCYENGDCLYLYDYSKPLDFNFFSSRVYDFRIWKQDSGSVFLSAHGSAMPVLRTDASWLEDGPEYYLGYTCSGEIESRSSNGWLDKGQSCIDGIAFTVMPETVQRPGGLSGSWKVTCPVVPYGAYERENNIKMTGCCQEMHFKNEDGSVAFLETVDLNNDISHVTYYNYDGKLLRCDDKTYEVYELSQKSLLLFQLPSSADSLYGEPYYRNVLKLEKL